jgi:hypothetical protein
MRRLNWTAVGAAAMIVGLFALGVSGGIAITVALIGAFTA